MGPMEEVPLGPMEEVLLEVVCMEAPEVVVQDMGVVVGMAVMEGTIHPSLVQAACTVLATICMLVATIQASLAAIAPAWGQDTALGPVLPAHCLALLQEM